MASSKLQKLMFLPQSPPLMLEFHSLHPLCNLSLPHHPPQNALNFSRLGIPQPLQFHLSPLLWDSTLIFPTSAS
ncbi:hypothetical protein ACSBR2_025604 [Camellia fascicularis]